MGFSSGNFYVPYQYNVRCNSDSYTLESVVKVLCLNKMGVLTSDLCNNEFLGLKPLILRIDLNNLECWILHLFFNNG